MKRGKPLVRSGILRRKAPMPTGKVLPFRSSRINPASARNVRQRPARLAAESQLGRRNGMGTCARCGVFTHVNGHERLSRAQGGDPTRPDCLLCQFCNGWCEDNPRAAARSGWKVSRLTDRGFSLAPHQAIRVDGTVHHFDGDGAA